MASSRLFLRDVDISVYSVHNHICAQLLTCNKKMLWRMTILKYSELYTFLKIMSNHKNRTVILVETKSHEIKEKRILKFQDFGVSHFIEKQINRFIQQNGSELPHTLPPISYSVVRNNNKEPMFGILEFPYIENSKHLKIESWRKWRTVLKHIAETLIVLHDSDYVHNDIKPSNILITEESTYLIDFGLTCRSNLTQSESPQWAGTAAYIPPEMLQSGIISSAGDIWSLGITLAQSIFKDFNGSIDLIYKHSNAYHVKLEELVQQMLIPDFSKRITAVTLLKFINEWELQEL